MLFPTRAVERAMTIREVILRAMSGAITWIQAADIIGCTPRSLRRWRARYERRGYDGLLDHRYGRPSPRRVPFAEVQRIPHLYRAQYAGFNGRHFRQIACRKHGVTLSYTYVKTALQKAGLLPTARARGRHRRRREPRPCFGERLHLDGSRHAWLAQRPEWRLTLLAIVDDATRRLLYAQLTEGGESVVAVMTALRAIFGRYGLPIALYTDRAHWAAHTPRAGARPDPSHPTQVGRALRHLGVEHILSYSPQARGRSERVNRTLQDRLVNELRAAGIQTIAAANHYVDQHFIPLYNATFGRPPADPASAFVAPGRTDLDQILCHEEERIVARDNTVVLDRLVLAIPRQPGRRSCAGLRVLVRRHLDGRLSVWCGRRCFASATTRRAGAGPPNSLKPDRSRVKTERTHHLPSTIGRRTGCREQISGLKSTESRNHRSSRSVALLLLPRAPCCRASFSPARTMLPLARFFLSERQETRAVIHNRGRAWRLGAVVVWCATVLIGAGVGDSSAAPLLVDPGLQVTTLVSGLSTPTSLAFVGPNDLLVLEKGTGQVRRVTNGVIQGTALDLPVNSASERGLLGIALDPSFATNQRVYLYWTQSSTGADSTVVSEVPLLGNRVDRFVWNGSTLAFDANLIQLRALQQDSPQPPAGNHNGGVLRFGPDGKLYVVTGDVGRRGQLQNLPAGPAGNGTPDDAFGGPDPDNAHLTGVVLRLNPDGSAPADNPFFATGAAIGGQAGANIQKVFAYGIRNGFGLAFDPVSGRLWMAENRDDSFDELNRVDPGMNGGWVQIMGPLDRLAEFKGIETSAPFLGLQQNRWPASNIADSPAAALAALFALPGSAYSDPEFSWKFGVAPGGIGFQGGAGLGAQYAGDLFVGEAGTALNGGYLFRFDLSPDRQSFALTDPSLADLVADNLNKFDGTESGSLLFGSNFGVVTDILTGPDGHLYVVSLSDGTIYEIGPLAAAVPAPPAWMAMALGVVAALCVRLTLGYFSPR